MLFTKINFLKDLDERGHEICVAIYNSCHGMGTVRPDSGNSSIWDCSSMCIEKSW